MDSYNKSLCKCSEAQIVEEKRTDKPAYALLSSTYWIVSHVIIINQQTSAKEQRALPTPGQSSGKHRR